MVFAQWLASWALDILAFDQMPISMLVVCLGEIAEKYEFYWSDANSPIVFCLGKITENYEYLDESNTEENGSSSVLFK